MTVPVLVRTVADAYLAAVDGEVPGLVEGFYLLGSVALDDFHPGSSDIDFVAVTSGEPDAGQVAALARVHGQPRRPVLDGIYATWSDLMNAPDLAAPGPHIHGTTLHRFCTHQRHPVTWHTLAQHGVAIRGPHPSELTVATDRQALAEWCLGNLDGYWRSWWQRSSRLFSKPGLVCLGSWGAAWGVLGVSRDTVVAGQITSKRGAGEYARTAFDTRWRRIIDECLRIRLGTQSPSLYRGPIARRTDVLAFMNMVITDAHHVGGLGRGPG
ncbi:hypothetical protein SMIR_41215 (plasmid) [Streptomyces mirabilis]|uniref:nucleotidyltransferase domain-containing protein n=1 Tax=Streptomyces mirabilis TaxID=68239 RepID=UPI001BAF2709|nr:nucleotidyltransferase domain-containing protein [Streptomyces mirabilis]QUW85496.1 hypothetical protein SMIR_41215 [Streptomyces mirabilis]